MLTLAECGDDTQEVGGKALGLAGLIAEGLPVPAGFCVTASAFRKSIVTSGLECLIENLLGEASFRDDNHAVSAAIAELFAEMDLTAEVAEPIREAYAALGDGAYVAVRSSATAEDLEDASFAGQQETYLYINGAEAVIEHVIKCWASLFSPQAIGYRSRFGVSAEDLAMAVVVQVMVPAEAAGVMMTLDPLTGDRSRIFVEAAYGLGEGVVRGDVGVDRFELAKDGLKITGRHLARKDSAHLYSNATDAVEIVAIPADRSNVACLSDAEVVAIGRLGADIEEAFGRPMDIEWAIASGPSGAREIFLLQARPETVWSNRPGVDLTVPDPLQTREPGDSWWSTTNLSEAFPGVLTPLDWSVIGPAVERATRGALVRIGALPQSEAEVPIDPADRAFGVFHGRIASRIDFFHRLGAMMPGTTPDAVVEQIFGNVPPGLSSQPSKDRYLHVALRFPPAFITAPRRTRAMRATSRTWWEAEITAMPGRGLTAAREAFHGAVSRMTDNLTTDGLLLLAGAQPIYDQLIRLAEKAGVDPSILMRGAGSHEEAEVVSDVWDASRDIVSVSDLVQRHGFHGPGEGVPSAHSWRENPQPLEDLISAFRELPESNDPRKLHTQGEEIRRDAERTLLAALRPWQRLGARAVLALARTYLPLRGKAARTQAIDVVRAAVRRIGECLEHDGVLKSRDDVVLLTAEELTGLVDGDVRELVEIRREQLERHRRFDIPGIWRGVPEPITAAAVPRSDVDAPDELSGIGASAGVVEGNVRVLHDPSRIGELVPGEILVARTTDPSWASLMFLSGGLVVDIGGLLSHAAIVARELGVPCVMGTQHGTTALRTGDRCRVDGRNGTVHILSRA
ncbi:PEP/pyruvate-binding domain-containing protein [Nocardia neocaledoniensis]|uniref:PEP/pyruvate-binding domain-containing protein n=1 Tax=Nocardia neocaledoniensis TaxID=236511 RepID=UPI002456D7B8|nr:PEP/pyruvate-binding domain-containing protein [Nocardia neocaledoniensis]